MSVSVADDCRSFCEMGKSNKQVITHFSQFKRPFALCMKRLCETNTNILSAMSRKLIQQSKHRKPEVKSLP